MAQPAAPPNPFYRTNRMRIFTLLILSTGVSFILVGALAYLTVSPPIRDYYQTTFNGKTTRLTALDVPNQSDAAVRLWANQAAIAIFNYDWVEFNQQLLNAKQFFTSSGWSEFVTAMNNSNILQTVSSKKLRVAAVATRHPIVLEKGLLLGNYTWRIQLPLLVTYTSASQTSQQALVVDMLITRIPTTESNRGVGIARFRMGYL